MVDNVNISAKEFEAKYKSKREVYTFLTVDAGAYLPPLRHCHHLLPQGHHLRPEEV